MKEEEFRNQLDRYFQTLYPDLNTLAIQDKIVESANSLKKDKAIRSQPWDEKDIYLITYGDSINTPGKKPLNTLADFIDHQLKEEINNIHILPFFPYSSDDGFSVIDYLEVDPALGNWEEIQTIAKRYHLMSDLVINHISSESKWFRNFLNDQPKYTDYFICPPKNCEQSKVIRPRTSPLLSAYKTPSGTKYVWTTFSRDQIDLNFGNPTVLEEMVQVLLEYISKGITSIRLDAIAFLWKEYGTTCLHLPNTHLVVKLFRCITDYISPHIRILTETNVPNEENHSYFSDGTEAHMIYQFPLPPLLLYALYSEDASYLKKWIAELPKISDNCTYFNFTASHDGIGVRPLEGLLPKEEINELVAYMESIGKISYRDNGIEKKPYELNCTYFDALQDTKTGDKKGHIDRFICSQTIMMSLKGIPAFYIHSLLATNNDWETYESTKENRALNRKKWDLKDLHQHLDKDSNAGQILAELKRRIQIRKANKLFNPRIPQELINANKPQIFGIKRVQDQDNYLIALFNISDKKIQIKLNFDSAIKSYMDLISQDSFGLNEDISINPYQALWLVPNNE